MIGTKIVPLLKDLPPEEEILAKWPSEGEPMLSVACVTYNHVNYLEDALAGFLAQKTDFRFEVVVHDDASTDGTTELLRQYATKYPKIVRPIIQESNKYSAGFRPSILIYPYLQGKYVAFCEGDDYWTDPYKLQKQVDFLEANLDYVISGHDACIINEHGKLVQDSKLPDSHKRDYSAKDLQEGRAYLLTLSWVFRRALSDDEARAERSVVKNGDNFLLSLLGQHGAAHYHDDIQLGVYRIHQGGVWSALDMKSREEAQVTTRLMIFNYYRRVGQNAVADVWWKRFDRYLIQRLPLSSLLRELAIRIILARKLRAVARRTLASVKRRLS